PGGGCEPAITPTAPPSSSPQRCCPRYAFPALRLQNVGFAVRWRRIGVSFGAAFWTTLLATFFPSAQQRFFRRGGDPSRTQLRDPVDELHRNRFGEGELDRPLSQLIAPEFIFERREKRPRCGKQRIVLLEAGEI